MMMRRRWLHMWRERHQLGMPKSITVTEATVARLQAAGWDTAAIKAYCRYLKDAIELVKTPEQQQRQQALVDTMTILVGSPVYTKMFSASHLSARQKLQLVLKQLNAQRDEYDFLQLSGSYKIYPNLAPTSLFLSVLRQTMQTAFPRHTLVSYAESNTDIAELAYQMHAFRSYIDRQCIAYVRQHQQGVTDYDKLRSYAQEWGLGLDYQTGANFHNRYHKVFTFPKNMKVQVSEHSKMAEFIVDLSTGEFISEWNVYRLLPDGTVDSNPAHYTPAELEQVANTESFNYGNPGHRSHRNLDIEHPADPLLRRKPTRYWHYEKDYNRGGRYIDIVNIVGHADFLAWQIIPEDSRLATYQDYVKECRQLELQRVYGFNRFYRNENE